MQTDTANIVQVLCDLSEASDEVFRSSETGFCSPAVLRHLTDLGAVEQGPRPDSVACNACDNDHPEVIEYEPDLRCYVHFCPEVGFVPVNDADLITYRFRTEWLADWLVKELPITSRVRPREIVPACAWHLGDTKCGDTVVTIVFARRISSQLSLGQLASALRTVHRADKGVVITTSLSTVHAVPLPDSYEFIHLPDVAMRASNGLEMDHHRFASWIRAMPSGTAKGAKSREGHPSQRSTIAKIFHLRRTGGIPVANVSTEARAIIGEWTHHAPDQEAPALSTVRGHVTKLMAPPAQPA